MLKEEIKAGESDRLEFKEVLSDNNGKRIKYIG